MSCSPTITRTGRSSERSSGTRSAPPAQLGHHRPQPSRATRRASWPGPSRRSRAARRRGAAPTPASPAAACAGSGPSSSCRTTATTTLRTSNVAPPPFMAGASATVSMSTSPSSRSGWWIGDAPGRSCRPSSGRGARSGPSRARRRAPSGRTRTGRGCSPRRGSGGRWPRDRAGPGRRRASPRSASWSHQSPKSSLAPVKPWTISSGRPPTPVSAISSVDGRRCAPVGWWRS